MDADLKGAPSYSTRVNFFVTQHTSKQGDWLLTFPRVLLCSWWRRCPGHFCSYWCDAAPSWYYLQIWKISIFRPLLLQLSKFHEFQLPKTQLDPSQHLFLCLSKCQRQLLLVPRRKRSSGFLCWPTFFWRIMSPPAPKRAAPRPTCQTQERYYWQFPLWKWPTLTSWCIEQNVAIYVAQLFCAQG